MSKNLKLENIPEKTSRPFANTNLELRLLSRKNNDFDTLLCIAEKNKDLSTDDFMFRVDNKPQQ